ncbi:MAG: adenylosuccinate synthase [Candidatus Gastranaerophilaceae bacterium]
MANTVIVGAQWGDEGKAKITDLLAEDADIIIRYQGGCNAGHTVVVGGETYKFHLIPSGVLYKNKICIIAAGTVINPVFLAQEINSLISRNIFIENLKISPLAHITMPYHIDIDSADENLLGDKKIGTTKRGIGPTYADKMARIGIKVEDLYDDEALNDKLDTILPQQNIRLERLYGLRTYSKEQVLEYCRKYREILQPYICENIFSIIKNAIKENKKILFEGAQGTMLDVNFGTYPYVTSSNPIAGGALTGSGVGPTAIKEVIGVNKAYLTRVGEGPFPTELLDESGIKLQQEGKEFGTTTGRIRRCGWFDVVVAKYSAAINGMTGMALTKLDVFNNFDKIKLCVAYKDLRNGKIYDEYPTNIYMHKYLEPIYEVFDGWNKNIENIKLFEELPENAKKYLKRIEELVEVPIVILSLGPEREQTIILKNPLLLNS